MQQYKLICIRTEHKHRAYTAEKTDLVICRNEKAVNSQATVLSSQNEDASMYEVESAEDKKHPRNKTKNLTRKNFYRTGNCCLR